jgi:hypothetical protein
LDNKNFTKQKKSLKRKKNERRQRKKKAPPHPLIKIRKRIIEKETRKHTQIKK